MTILKSASKSLKSKRVTTACKMAASHFCKVKSKAVKSNMVEVGLKIYVVMDSGVRWQM